MAARCACSPGQRMELPGLEGTVLSAPLPASRFLAHYASRLRSVEVNATFYRMPLGRTLALWRSRTPADIVRAPGRAADHARATARRRRGGGGPVLGAAPSSALRSAGALPAPAVDEAGRPAAARARRARPARRACGVRVPPRAGSPVTSCRPWPTRAPRSTSPTPTTRTAPLEATAPFGYLRLRRTSYGADDLVRWAEYVRASAGRRRSCSSSTRTRRAVEYALRITALVAPGSALLAAVAVSW